MDTAWTCGICFSRSLALLLCFASPILLTNREPVVSEMCLLKRCGFSFILSSKNPHIFSLIPLTVLKVLFLILWKLLLIPVILLTLIVTMVQAPLFIVYNWLIMLTNKDGFQLVQARSACDKAGKLSAALWADHLVAKDRTLWSEPTACLCNSTSAHSKKLTKKNSFEVLIC